MMDFETSAFKFRICGKTDMVKVCLFQYGLLSHKCIRLKILQKTRNIFATIHEYVHLKLYLCISCAKLIMRESLSKHYKSLSLGLVMALLCGCSTADPIVLDTPEHLQAIEQDVASLYPHISPASGNIYSLSLDHAVERALQYNLDARVAALETLVAKDNISLAQFEGAPNITASGTYTRRNVVAASSSESIETGTQSLEPSTSSEKLRRLADLKAQWNILDSVIAYLNGESAEDEEVIAQERLRKVQHNIERDVISAYWQAYVTQKTQRQINSLSQKISRLNAAVESAMGDRILSVTDASNRMDSLVNEASALNVYAEQAQLGDMELKAILSLPPDTDLVLVTEPHDFKLELLNAIRQDDMNTLIKAALKNRPEVREAFMEQNIAVRDKERELISTFPGLNLIYSRNYDSNRFLEHNEWTDFTAALTQSLTDFISLPTRYRAAENRERLEQNRRQALIAAVIAQVYIGKIRIEMAEANYKIAAMAAKQADSAMRLSNARLGMKAVSGFDATVSAASGINKVHEKNQAYATLQEAYIDMLGTLGFSLADTRTAMSSEGGNT
jgi:outer membrane protein TolC